MRKFIPENLNIKDLECKRKNIRYEKCVVILDLITRLQMFDKHFINENDFVRIASLKLREIISDYKKYIDYLIELNIIEVNNSYFAGQYSKGYRFKAAYRKKVKLIELKNKRLIKRLRKQKMINEFDDYAYLRRFICPLIEIDIEKAVEWIESRFIEENIEDKVKALRKRNYRLMKAYAIDDNDFNFSVDKTSQRVHTNITNLDKGLRKFISYDGKELVGIDIVNAQPFFLSVLLNPKFTEGVISTSTGYPTFNSTIYPMCDINIEIVSDHTYNLPYSSIDSILSSYIMLPKKINDNREAEYRGFINSISNGTFYEDIWREMTGKELNYETRELVKTLTYTLLFSSNKFIGQNDEGAKIKKRFSECFPYIYGYISYYKRNEKARLARILQKIESYIIIEKVARRIRQEQSNVVLLTIHDCAVTTVGNENYVRQIMEEECKKAIGIKPKFRIEYWK